MAWFKIGKGIWKAVYCHLAYLTSLPSTSCEMPGWVKLKLESRLPEEKGKGQRERYTPLKAEFQRIAMRDKKAFISEQCKEIEENK